MPVVTDYTALISGDSWSGIEVTGQPIFVTYSFLGAAPASHADPAVMGSAVSTFQAFDGPDRTVARTALAEWANACGLTLLEVAPAKGSINFSWYDFTGTAWDGSGGFAFFPFGSWNSESYPYFIDQMPPGTAAGDIFINLDYAVGGLPEYGLLLHEIGHALGLKHPFETFGSHTQTLDPALDTTANTVMSYTGASPTTLGPLDIDAAVHLYGAATADGTQVASWSWDSVAALLTQNGGGGNDLIQGVTVADLINGKGGADTITGLEGADTLVGAAGNDLMFGGGDADLLNGGAGDDTMLGGRGNDRYVVDSSGDWALELPNEGTDVVVSSATFGLWDDVENLTLSGTAAIDGFGNGAANRIAGNNAANFLSGYDGNDNLIGNDGNDTLQGDGGRDRLTGGAGNDWFTFNDPTEGLDKIVDFVPGEDKVALYSWGFDGLLSAAGHFVAHASYAATTAAGTPQFIYNTATGILAYDADGMGAGVAQRLASFLGAPALAEGDLLFFV